MEPVENLRPRPPPGRRFCQPETKTSRMFAERRCVVFDTCEALSKEDKTMKTTSLTAILLALLAVASLVLVSGCGQLFADKVLSVGERELTVTEGPEKTPRTHEVAPDAEVTLDGEQADLEDIRPGDSVKVTTEKHGEQELAVKVEATRSEKESAADKESGSDELSPPPIGPPEQPAFEEPALPPEGEMESPAAENESAAEEDAEAPRFGQATPAPGKEDKGAFPEPEEDAEILFAGVITLVGEDQIRVQGRAQSANLAEKMVFKLTVETEITLAGEPANKEDLATGMEVTVTAERQGEEALARRIDAKPMPV